MGGAASRKVFLRRITAPGFFEHARSQPGGDLARPVRRPAVHHHYLVGALEALDGAGNVTFFVQRDDGGTDSHQLVIGEIEKQRTNTISAMIPSLTRGF